MIYFDNSATSMVAPEVKDEMLPYLLEEYGNPSSKYYCKAENVKQAVEQAREKVARLINCSPEELIFTSGATESTNLIIKGTMDYQRYYENKGNHIITSKSEHKATLNVCRFLNGEIYSSDDPKLALSNNNFKVDRGFEASFIDVDRYGRLDLSKFENAIRESTVMASIVHVNNEIGTINDIEEISSICRDKGILFHADTTQSVGKIELNMKELGLDFMSFSAHKIHGPKGVGVAYLRGDDYGAKPITSLIHGGDQELGIRAGTLAVHNIVGIGKAAELALDGFKENNKKLEQLDEYLIYRLRELESCSILNTSQDRVKGIVSLIVDKDDFNNERFIKKISDRLAISTGSACSAGKPSHVISAIGQADRVSKILRISLSRYSEKAEIDRLIEILAQNI